MISRRSALGLAVASTALLTSDALVAQANEAATIEDQIKKWRDDPANIDYFEVVRDPGKGSLILPPEDDRVKWAAQFLARVPKNKPPIEIVRFMIKELPETSRMEWPRDRPNDPRPANPIIVAFFAATKTEPFAGDQTAWCAALACWALQRAGIDHPRNAGSRSFRSWGTETSDPAPGDLVVFRSRADPVHGHVTFFDGFTDATKKRFYLVGGNQADSLSRANWPVNPASLELHSFRTAQGLRA